MANTTDPLDAENRDVVLVGLNFGPTFLSNVFFIDKDEYYTGIPCDEIYKSFWQDALKKEGHLKYHPNELVETLSRHIKGAVKMGVWALDNNPTLEFKVMAITVPDHWETPTRTCTATAMRLAGHPLDGQHMIISASRATGLALRMNRYIKDKYLVLLLDYNKSYLHVTLVEMCGTCCTVKSQVFFPHFGEDELHKESAGPPSDGKSMDNSIIVPDKFTSQRPICNNKAAHFKPIINTVSEFILRIAASKTSSQTVTLPLRDAVRDVRYIVINGEASIAGRGDLCDVIKRMFVNEEWVKVGHKQDCGAYGATLMARQQWQNPKHLGDWKDLPEYVPDTLG